MSLFNYDGSTPDKYKFNTDEASSATDFGATFDTSNLLSITQNNTGTVEKTESKESGNTTPTEYKNPLGKIANGGVLQYPIDLDTDLQDYFEIQIFNYRPARSLPSIKKSNQDYNKENGKFIDKDSKGNSFGGYFSGSNRRGNRQNFRLQDLQSTIQIPIPPSIKDMNAVDFAGGSMSGLAAELFGPTVNAFLGGSGKGPNANPLDQTQVGPLRNIARELLKRFDSTAEVAKTTFSNLLDGVSDKAFSRVTGLNAIAQAVAALGVQIDVNQAITRVSGAVRNPNLELLFKGPSLRNFSFTIRFTPRDTDESKRVRMIIRALKQHSAVKRNPQVFPTGDNDPNIGSNFLLGTPDVFKLRYIKARTQRDIKGLNKFKTCALNSISVDYTGEAGRFAAYEEDSQPVTTIVQLSFTELTPIYDVDYTEFTTDDDVGL
tara:strand:- start:447 stop:1745 length:1299 start_codon:yes stop_codon:yes gene_type:complete